MAKEITIIGGGPGGYTAAIRAAQLGAGVALVEEKQLGGTCLNLGCIPTKVFYKHAQIMESIKKAGEFGISIEGCSLDIAKMHSRKKAVVEQLGDGIHKLLKANGVEIIYGRAEIKEPGLLKIVDKSGSIREKVSENILIATGSSPAVLSVPGNDLPGVVTSEEILSLEKIPPSIVVIGGGVIGIEWAGIFKALGSKVVVLEYMPNILPNFDTDLSKRLAAGLKRKGIQIETEMLVKEIAQGTEGLQVSAAGKKGENRYHGEIVLVSTGRTINTEGLNLEGVGVLFDRKGIKVDSRYQTTVPGIYAVGDVIGGLMLAHVAAEEGAAAVEGIMGQNGHLNYDSVPSCVFTFPEVAVVGMTEEQARESNLMYVTSKFMFGANGKALTMGEGEGFVKVISEKDSGRLLGAHIMGPHASDLIHEPALAIANKLKVPNITSTVHAHPTLGEAFSEAVLGLENRAIHMVPGNNFGKNIRLEVEQMVAVHRVGVGQGKHNLEAVVVQCGDDLSVYLGGGEKPHVGTIVLCQSRPSLTKGGSLSYTTSLLNLLGHKDDGIARPLAEKLCSALKCTVVVTAGVHIENATPADIRYFESLSEELSERILELLR